MKKLAVITTHPIQYNAPLFAMLSKRGRILIKVFYTWENSKNGIYDRKFNKKVKWDIPLLQGYDYVFVKNTAKEQGSHHYKGIVNPTLIKEIEDWGANAILVFGWNFHSHFRAMRFFKGKATIIFRGDSTLLDEKSGIKTILRRIVLSFVYSYINYALYVGTNNRDYYLKHGVKSDRLVFAPHSIDNNRFIDNQVHYENEAREWRKLLKVQDKDTVFLFAGKFEDKKAPLLIIEAAKKLQNTNFKFILAGSGKLENNIKDATKTLSNVILLPFQNQSKMPILYRMADVFILPSKGPGETWGLAINEAMACKRAVMASNKVGCAIDLIVNNINGYIFESNNLDDFMNKINSLDKEIITQMGAESSKIIAKYNYSVVCDVIENLVSDI